MLGVRTIEHKRGQQRRGDNRPHGGSHHELTQRGGHQILRSGQRRCRDQVGAHRDRGNGHPVAGQSVRPTDRAHRPFREQHSGGEPGGVSRRPVEKVHSCRGVDGQQPPPEAGHRHRRDHRYPGTNGKPVGQKGQDRQRQVEAHLHRQAPHLGQTRREGKRHIDLREGQIGQPDSEAGAVGLR